MNSSDSGNRTTWRQLLKRCRGTFQHWLQESEQAHEALQRIADQLSEFIIHRIDSGRRELSEAPIEFWNRIPDVRNCCSDPATFDKPFAVEAYAYVHMLE